MSFNYNHATLVGRLTRDPETKQITATNSKTTFVIAIDRPYNKKEGEKQETDFVNIVAWGRLAVIGSKYLRKGTPVLIDGRIQIRIYEKDNERHWMTEIVADNFQILESTKSAKAQAEEIQS